MYICIQREKERSKERCIYVYRERRRDDVYRERKRKKGSGIEREREGNIPYPVMFYSVTHRIGSTPTPFM